MHRMKKTPCHKIGYTKREAETQRNALAHRQPRRRGRVKALRIYPCPDCNLRHLTKHV
jgi:hypothetical protein